MNDQRIIICGPTASGKSALAIELAQELSKRNGEETVIINADSQQVYKELPIISAQPTEDEKKLVPHHLFGHVSGAENYDVARWINDVQNQLKKHAGKNIIIVGGTGMYLNAFLNGLSEIPEIPNDIREHVRAMSKDEVADALGEEADGNTQRMKRALEVKLFTGKSIKDFHNKNAKHNLASGGFVTLHKNVSRETLYKNINSRFEKMINSGAVDEVKNLAKMDLHLDLPILKAVGYREIKSWLSGEISKEDAITLASQKSRNYAKRQMTWFRNQMPFKIDVENVDDALDRLGMSGTHK